MQTVIAAKNKLKRTRQFGAFLVVAAMHFWPSAALTDTQEIDLPELTQGGSALMSSQREKELGNSWLRQFRGSVPLLEDPLVFEYIENLTLALAMNSELDDRELKLVVVDNDSINAFAVPGGIVGINSGLLLSAESEGQLASVVGHELAHLSQQHFARRVEASRSSSLTSIAGMLAGIILAATAGGDEAVAAIATSQAVAIDSQLRYSRSHEREADQLGMKTLVKSGYDPAQAAAMFRRMQDSARLYGNSAPEFLRTHPITKSRIADAENRARQYRTKNPALSRATVDSLDFQLIKTRLHVDTFNTPNEAVTEYKRRLTMSASNSSSLSDAEIVARYGLALSEVKNRNWTAARETLDPVLQATSGRLIYSLLDIEIDRKAGKTNIALRRLRDLYSLMPGNYAVGMELAHTAIEMKHYPTAQRVLTELAESRPLQSDIWYSLAEAHGLANNIVELHTARAEFFLLRNRLDQSRFHLSQALRLARDNVKLSARIKQRLTYVVRLLKESRRRR